MNKKDTVASVWNLQGETFNMMGYYYDGNYINGDISLFGMEVYALRYIDSHPGTAVTDMARDLSKTTSACSQTIKKLLQKGAVIQERNPDNRRIYNLFLTEKGQKACDELQEWDDYGLHLISDALKEFTGEDMEKYKQIQRAVNTACYTHIRYMRDIVKDRK